MRYLDYNTCTYTNYLSAEIINNIGKFGKSDISKFKFVLAECDK